jgi:hypothetical protein
LIKKGRTAERFVDIGAARRSPASGSMPSPPDTPSMSGRWLPRPASFLPTSAIWAAGAGLVLTRVVMLAHWASDVAAGLASGALTERLLRFVTGYDRDVRDNKGGIAKAVPKS